MSAISGPRAAELGEPIRVIEAQPLFNPVPEGEPAEAPAPSLEPEYEEVEA